MNQQDAIHMTRALELAKLGRGFVEPNPMVGCVIADQDGVIGEGYHERCGHNHAERNAIAAIPNMHRERLPRSTLYVTLEPCPMCAGALAWSQIGKIVFAAADAKKGFSLINNPLLHPKTIVEKGVLANECQVLLQRFFRERRK